MARKLSVAAVLVTMALAGCAPSGRVELGDVTSTPDVRTAMAERLHVEQVPALRSIETWHNSYGPGLTLTTDHYEIHTTLLEPLMLRAIPGFVESAYHAYNRQLARPIETVSRFRIYMFADRLQWEAFTREFAGEQAEIFCRIKSGAYYLNGACVVYDIGRERTLSVLGHEGWHQFANCHFTYRLPSWLDEGIAMQFESGVYADGTFIFEPAANQARLDALNDALVSNKMIPLSQLVATSPGEVLASDQTEAVMAFYSQSYALVRFLREADRGQRLPLYQRLVWEGLRGQWPLDGTTRQAAADRNLPRTVDWNRIVGPQVFACYVSADMAALQREYLAFCRRAVREKAVARDDAGEYAFAQR